MHKHTLWIRGQCGFVVRKHPGYAVVFEGRLLRWDLFSGGVSGLVAVAVVFRSEESE